MATKIKIKLDLLGMLDRTRDEFKKEVKTKFHREYIGALEKGVNPLNSGDVKQAQYSDSYKKQIQGKAMFFRKGGKVIAIEELSSKEMSAYRASDSARAANRRNKEFLSSANEKFKGKKISPVNLKMSGGLHRSFKLVETNKGVRAFFDDPKLPGSQYSLSEIHNNIGVGKDKVKRRLLPTEQGERFNSSLFNRVLTYLKDAIKKATK